ncbi:MAG: TIGR04076 family protein [Bacillota bacterium]
MVDDLKIKIVQIKGNCPVYHKGDTFYIKNGYRLNSKKELCMHSLASVLPYYNALSRGIKADQLGLAKNSGKEKAYLQCLDPCSFTGGGTVIMEVSLVND